MSEWKSGTKEYDTKDRLIKLIGEKFFEREELQCKVKALTEELRDLTTKLRTK